jgi:formate hydrogenlyase subunit 6/NADH:ubiquinone oxidoreductase subunit I
MKILFDLEEPRRNGPSPDLYRQSLPPRRKELLILTRELESNARNVNLEDYPIMDLQINKALCNLCEVCSVMCPTGALRFAEKENSGSIAFSLGRCTGCRLCIEVCPNSCVSSSDASLGDINSNERVLIENKMCRCKSCNFKFVHDSSFVGEEICSMCVKKRSLVTM